MRQCYNKTFKKTNLIMLKQKAQKKGTIKGKQSKKKKIGVLRQREWKHGLVLGFRRSNGSKLILYFFQTHKIDPSLLILLILIEFIETNLILLFSSFLSNFAHRYMLTRKIIRFYELTHDFDNIAYDSFFLLYLSFML